MIILFKIKILIQGQHQMKIFIYNKINYNLLMIITILNRKIDTHIGRILNIDNKGIYVSSLEGYLILSKIEDTDGNKVDNNNFKIGNFLE